MNIVAKPSMERNSHS